jgi:TonB family protein
MDPVSKMLSDRERAQPGLWPWVVLATVLHGSLVGVTFLITRAASARPAQLPVVAVRIVQPRQVAPRSVTRSRPQPTRAPAPPTAVPTSVPEPEPTAPPQQQDFSADAMPAPDSRATPVPTPAQPGTYDTGRGLSVGQEAGRRESGIPPDFHFTYYVERMLALIESRWYKPAVPKGTRALARFRIHSDGRMDLIELEESSGHPSFDRAALRALYAANPLPPLPPAYLNPSLTVHLAFTE